jgi:hypothetical protein
MKYAKFFGILALAAGMASAADFRDTRNDYRQVDRVQTNVARDRGRMNEDVRWEGQMAGAREHRLSDAHYRNVRHDYRDRDWR